jgi:hypothetical protein
MDTHTQLERYRELMGREGLERQWARDGRNAEGYCGTCGVGALEGHRTDCPRHPKNLQRATVMSPPAA